ncbi:MAG: EthD domain-containing protein [Woeseiaceae bacterium]
MIRLNYYVRRKPGMSAEEFESRWRESHGSLWEKYAEALGVRRYTQVYDDPEHSVATALKAGYKVVGEPYDGLSVACWSEIAVLEDALQTKEGAAAWRAIFDDECEFIDHASSMLSFGTDHAVLNPRGKLYADETSEMVRGAYFPKGLPGIELGELHRHWIAIHGGLTHDFSSYSPNIRYFQVHSVENAVAVEMRAKRGMQPSERYFGHAEVWISQAEMDKAAKNPIRQELFPLFIADIEAFCDMDTGYFIIGKEKHFVDKPIYTLPLPQPAFTIPQEKTGT